MNWAKVFHNINNNNKIETLFCLTVCFFHVPQINPGPGAAPPPPAPPCRGPTAAAPSSPSPPPTRRTPRPTRASASYSTPRPKPPPPTPPLTSPPKRRRGRTSGGTTRRSRCCWSCRSPSSTPTSLRSTAGWDSGPWSGNAVRRRSSPAPWWPRIPETPL